MEIDLKALGLRFRSWYPVAYAMEMRRTWLLVWWMFRSGVLQQHSGYDLMMRMLREIRLLEQQVQSSPQPDRMRVLLIRAQFCASRLALDLSWLAGAVRFANAFRSQLEIAVQSQSLSKKDAAWIGDAGSDLMRTYDEVMTACGHPADE